MNLNFKLKSIFLASNMLVACTASLCKNGEVAMNSESSIWRKLNSHPSCKGEYKSEGFSQCKGDHTSIKLDMSKVSNKQACFAYSTEGPLNWDMKPGTTITFDAEWEGCDKVWTAPLWLMPSEWHKPQGLTGEIDLLETCKGHGDETFTTSIICNDHPNSQCYEPHWGSTLGGSGHFQGKIDAAGTWTMKKCDLGGSNCELISRYPNYLSLNHGSQRNLKFHFKSDLYNGGSGDGGWTACGTLNMNTNCKYTIANIKVGAGTPDPAPSPSPSGDVCKDWCAGDTANRSKGRHCGGDMNNSCGGCPYCHSGVCNDWCAQDRFSHPDQEARHCGGNMADQCGGCDYCQSSCTPEGGDVYYHPGVDGDAQGILKCCLGLKKVKVNDKFICRRGTSVQTEL